MNSAYRSAYHHIVSVRIAETKRASESVAPHLRRLRSICAARIARALAGGVGIVGAILMSAYALGEGDAVTFALLGSGVAALATYTLVRLVLTLAAFAGVKRWSPPKLTGELDADLARIDASHPLRPIARRLQALEVWSTTLPLAALSLLMPLTIHYAVNALIGELSWLNFASWIRFSLLFTVHAHVALAILAVSFGQKLSKLNRTGVGSLSIEHEWVRAWGMTIFVSAVPGVLLLAIPPLLTAITGLAFIPFMFILMHRRLIVERLAMTQAEEASLTRIAVEAETQLKAFTEVDVTEIDLAEADESALHTMRR